MSLKNKFKNFFSLDDEEYEYEYIETDREEIPEEEESKDRTAYQSKAAGKQNVVSLQSVQKSSKVVLSEPRVYAEAQEIADHVKNRRLRRRQPAPHSARPGQKNRRFLKRNGLRPRRRYSADRI